MARIGYALIALGFLVAALYASITPQGEDQVQWGRYLPGLIASVVGVAMIQLSRRQEATASHRLADDLETLRATIGRVAERMTEFDAHKEEMEIDAFHRHIDATFRDDLAAFADARKSLIHAYSVQIYTDVMNDFAAGERYLNRVWSASVDGYIDEVKTYIGLARKQFESTRDKIAKLG